MKKDAETLLEKAEIKPTSNRLLVVRALLSAERPLSLIELETTLETLERSSISRVLSLLVEKDVIHMFEDGRGVAKYEVCPGETHCSFSDMHAHFYCDACQRVYCFENIAAPKIDIPEGFDIKGINYMLKGICPNCKK